MDYARLNFSTTPDAAWVGNQMAAGDYRVLSFEKENWWEKECWGKKRPKKKV